MHSKNLVHDKYWNIHMYIHIHIYIYSCCKATIAVIVNKYFMSVLVTCHYGTIPETINLKGGKVYFGSWFQKFQSMAIWTYCFGPVVATSSQDRKG
jgi:hypothetical protein